MTRLLFIKLLRDIRTTWGRVLMMVISISLSLIAFSTMLYARSIALDQTEIGYASTNPASARLTFNPGIALDQVEPVLAAARTEPGVIDATMRSALNVQIQKEGDESTTIPLKLFVAPPNDPISIATFRVEQGSWPSPPDGLLMERSALESLKLKVGDSVSIIDSTSKLVQLKITGVVHDSSLAPAREQGYGYISTDSLPLLGKPPILNQLAITVADQPGQAEPSHDRDAIVRTALSLADRLKEMPGVQIEQVAVPPPYEHPHQEISNILLSALLAFGSLSLLLSAILIATMFNGLLAQQIPQIGILKAIGARSSRILQLYLLMILLVSGVATTLAFIPGILLGRALAQLVLTASVNVDVTGLSIPWWTYATVVITGIALPMFISLVPLIQASRRTVRESLDDRGIDRQGVTATRLYDWLSKIRGLNRTLLMAFRNIFRRKARFLLSVGLLAIAGAIFIGGLNTRTGLQAIPDTLAEVHSWDVEVRLNESASATELTNIIAQVPGVSRVETWTTVLTGIQYPGQINVIRTYPDEGHGNMGVTAVPLDSSMFSPPPVLEGRWLSSGDTDAIVLPQTFRKTFPDANIGKTIQLSIEGQATDWRVVGIVKELSAATCPCVSNAGFEQATGRSNQANLIRIVTDSHDPQMRIDVGEAVKQVLEGRSIKVQSVRTLDSLLAGTGGHLDLLVALILFIASVIALVGLIGLGSMMSTNVIERTREFGIMNAIGAPASTVRRLVVSEGIFIAVISCVVAVVPALILTMVMGTGLGNLFFNAAVPFRVSIVAIIIWIVVVILGAVLATLAPASRAARLTIREALAYL